MALRLFLFFVFGYISLDASSEDDSPIYPQIFPTDVNITVGQEIRITCLTKNNKKLDWQHLNTVNSRYTVIVADGKRVFIEANITSGKSVLSVLDATKHDEGRYICSDGDDSDYSSSAVVFVAGESDTGNCPRGAAIIPAIAGEKFELKLATTKPDTVQVDFKAVQSSRQERVFIEGHFVDDFALNSKYKFNISNGNFTLRLSKVEISDAGGYTFSEDYGLGRKSLQELIVISVECECLVNDAVCVIKHNGNCFPQVEWNQQIDSNELQTTTLMFSNDTYTTIKLTQKVSSVASLCLITISPPFFQVCTSRNVSGSDCTEANDTRSANYLVLAITGFLLTVVVVMVGIFMFCRKKLSQRREIEAPTELESLNGQFKGTTGIDSPDTVRVCISKLQCKA